MNELPLHDIHLPEAVSIWPLALGWWLLLLLIFLCALSVYLFVRYKKKKIAQFAYKKAALNELSVIIKNNELNTHVESLREISGLLRRITLSYLPRKEVASLTGGLWVKKLNSLSSEQCFSEKDCDLLSTATYQQTTEFNRENLIQTCQQWIVQLPAKVDS